MKKHREVCKKRLPPAKPPKTRGRRKHANIARKNMRDWENISVKKKI